VACEVGSKWKINVEADMPSLIPKRLENIILLESVNLISDRFESKICSAINYFSLDLNTIKHLTFKNTNTDLEISWNLQQNLN